MRLTKSAVVAAATAATWCVLTPAAQAQPAPPPPPLPAEAGPTTPGAPGTATPSTGAPATGLKTTIDADGSYTVGTDIAPGVYQSAGPNDGGACYWKRSAGDQLVDNRLTKKPSFVQIMPTDTTFTTSDCQAWQLTNAPMPPQPGPGDLLGQLTQAIGSGMFSGGPR